MSRINLSDFGYSQLVLNPSSTHSDLQRQSLTTFFRMPKLSFLVFLTLLASFCAAENSAIGVKNEAYPTHDVETTWKKFMVRLTKNIRTTGEATQRDLNSLRELSAVVDEKQNEGVVDVVQANGSKASQSCSSATGCTATASETNSSQSSSTGTSSTSTGTSSSSSNTSSSSSGSTGGSGSSSSSSSNGSSSSSSSSSG